MSGLRGRIVSDWKPWPSESEWRPIGYYDRLFEREIQNRPPRKLPDKLPPGAAELIVSIPDDLSIPDFLRRVPDSKTSIAPPDADDEAAP